MLLASLVDLGAPFLSGPSSATDLLPRVASVSGARADDFYSRVVIVEADREAFHSDDKDGLGGLSGAAYTTHPPAIIGQHDPRRLGLAAFIPSGGGNKAGPLGRYPTAVYPVYETNLARFLRRGKHAGEPEESARKAVRDFVRARAPLTAGSYLSNAQLDVVADAVYDRLDYDLGEAGYEGKSLLAILEVGQGTPFEYSPIDAPAYLSARELQRQQLQDTSSIVVAASRLRPGYVIRADLDKILEGVWWAKLAEGEKWGTLENGSCSICGHQGHVTAAYSPSWPFASQTGKGPLPMNGANRQKGLGSHNLALSTALCRDCYRAFVVGVSLFRRLSRMLPVRIRREIFASAHSGTGRQNALLRPINSLPPVRIAAFATPLLPPRVSGITKDPGSTTDGRELTADDAAGKYARALDIMAEGGGSTLERVIGAESKLPKELATDEYRVTTVYYGSPPEREGVVELYGIVEDIIPSRMLALEAVVRDLARDPGLSELAKALGVKGLEDRGLASLPYLLSRAYGGSELWQRLAKALGGEALPSRPFRKRAWRRIADLTRDIQANAYAIREEVYFYLVYEEFLAAYQHHVRPPANARTNGSGEGIVKPVAQMLATLRQEPPEQWPLDDEWALGFAIGHVLRDFARQYYAVTGRNLLRHKILTFAGVPTPEGVVKKGLSKLDEYAAKNSMNVRPDLYEKSGYCLDAYRRMAPTTSEGKDSFMLGFKSGYWVSAPKPPAEDGTANNKEGGKSPPDDHVASNADLHQMTISVALKMMGLSPQTVAGAADGGYEPADVVEDTASNTSEEKR